MISMKYKYQTRSGKEVILVTTNGPDTKFPVIGYIKDDEARMSLSSWTINGFFMTISTNSPNDLVLKKEIIHRILTPYGEVSFVSSHGMTEAEINVHKRKGCVVQAFEFLKEV